MYFVFQLGFFVVVYLIWVNLWRLHQDTIALMNLVLLVAHLFYAYYAIDWDLLKAANFIMIWILLSLITKDQKEMQGEKATTKFFLLIMLVILFSSSNLSPPLDIDSVLRSQQDSCCHSELEINQTLRMEKQLQQLWQSNNMYQKVLLDLLAQQPRRQKLIKRVNFTNQSDLQASLQSLTPTVQHLLLQMQELQEQLGKVSNQDIET